MSKRGCGVVWSVLCGVLAFCGVVACDPPEPKKQDPTPIDPNIRGLLQICPGAKGCLRSEGALKTRVVGGRL
jgi:hypothetical protein